MERKLDSEFFFPLSGGEKGSSAPLYSCKTHASQLSENRIVSNCSDQQPPAVEKESNSAGTLYQDHSPLVQLMRREHPNSPRSKASHYQWPNAQAAVSLVKRTQATIAANKGQSKATCHLLAQLAIRIKINTKPCWDSRSQTGAALFWGRAHVTQPRLTCSLVSIPGLSDGGPGMTSGSSSTSSNRGMRRFLTPEDSFDTSESSPNTS